jgi:peptidoglycan/xylan/chitin deacetylase (PgdA/CDA1 family)
MVTESPLILGYHAVSAGWESPLAVTEEALFRQLACLRKRGYEGFTFAESERLRRRGRLPARSVVVTFDDGFASVLKACPILAEVGYPATVFVVAEFTQLGKPLRWPGLDGVVLEELAPLSWADLESLVDAGWEVGSHTMSHPLLTLLEDKMVAAELEESRRVITQRVGTCETLAYPYGIADARVAAHARAAGYLGACVLLHSHRVDEAHRRARVFIARRDRRLRLALKLSPSVRKLRHSPVTQVVDRLRIATGDWVPTVKGA